MLWLFAIAACDRALVERPQLARLTHLQWENSVRDLFGGADGEGSATFLRDVPTDGGFDNQADALVVAPELWVDYQRAAERVAARVVHDAELYPRLVPEDPTRDVSTDDPVWLHADDGTLLATGAQLTDAGWTLDREGSVWAEPSVSAGEWTAAFRVFQAQYGAEQAYITLQAPGLDPEEFHVVARSPEEPDVFELTFTASGGPQRLELVFLNPEPERRRSVTVMDVRLRPGGDREVSRSRLRRLARDWIRRFGAQVHRRPLSSSDEDRYLELFELGAATPYTGLPFRDGVYTVLIAMLQSPHFLYRTEWVQPGAPLDPLGRPRLDGWSVASKLSYGLWNTAPDALLVEAAIDGTLDEVEGLRAHAERLLADPRAEAAVDHFHAQLLDVADYEHISGDVEAGWDERTPDAMRAEALDTTRAMVFGGGSVRHFFTSPQTVIDGTLAEIYGVNVDSTVPTPVALDPEQRAGVLTLSGFLAVNADEFEIDSIHRGVFVSRRFLCAVLPPPPDNVTPLPPPEEGLQNRERVDRHTGEGTCGEGCHSTIINPVGFAFENYDVRGAWREQDAGRPVRADGTFTFTDGARSWDGPVGFAHAVAESESAHRCLMANWLRFTHGREVVADDRHDLDRIMARSVSDDVPIRSLIVDLVTSDSFRSRVEVAP